MNTTLKYFGLFILLATGYNLQAQTIIALGTITNDSDGGSPGVTNVCLNPNGELELTLTVSVANIGNQEPLDIIFDFDPEGTGVYGLPGEYPPLYLRYTIEGLSSVTIPVTEFYEFGSIYTFMHSIDPIDYATKCERMESESVFRKLLTLELLTNSHSNPSLFVPYPICNYTDEGELFSCDVLPWTPCVGKFEPCDSDHISVRYANLDLYCNCGSGAQGRSVNHDIRSDDILISPNPFDRYITITNTFQIIEAVDVYNINGQRYLHKNYDQPGPEMIELSTEQMPPGIYIVSLLTSDGVLLEKLVKL